MRTLTWMLTLALLAGGFAAGCGTREEPVTPEQEQQVDGYYQELQERMQQHEQEQQEQ